MPMRPPDRVGKAKTSKPNLGNYRSKSAALIAFWEIVNELMKSLKKELRSLRRKFNDERRTRIIDVVVNESAQAAIASAAKTKGKKPAKKDPALTVSPALTFERLSPSQAKGNLVLAVSIGKILPRTSQIVSFPKKVKILFCIKKLLAIAIN